MALALIDVVTVRAVEPDDITFILSTINHWASRRTSDLWRGWAEDEIYHHMHTLLLWALGQGGYQALIACHRDNSSTILGFLIAHFESNHIFCQYTKFDFRRLGIQKYLLMPTLVDPTRPMTYQFYSAKNEIYSKRTGGRNRVKDLITQQMMAHADRLTNQINVLEQALIETTSPQEGEQ
jgi:hypothetical protein